MTRTAEVAEALRQREQRLSDAIELKVPDWVPIAASFDYFSGKYAGISNETAFYDAHQLKKEYGVYR